MSNQDLLRNAFVTVLGLPPEQVSDELTYGSVAQWDSVAHMSLITELEEVFGVMLETEDIIGLSSMVEARRILSKYGVAF
ncbi:acyl carrier protein [Roseateles cellulosilyticus]|uniref:Acyl carrier protein n=1 Tax=Pelomonas cellulosilytica TaxID=2906762 RepID=A0ABS8XTS2_9BURK|nr:acyl carrier protein [Pelomonas sp. P8]MCE4556119.1 acyl carrier protein [Pelomonas sp. P8]